jgi:putative secretion ATPase (PEP-CTERM system associated)
MYESFYGLTGKPFQLNPDPEFYFGSRQHTRAMAYLEYGLHQNEGFIVVTGEVGAGKTMILRSLLAKLDPRQVVAGQLVSTQLDAEDTLRMVGAAFGLRTKDVSKSDMLLSLEAFLIALSQQGKRALLIVDEAQNLTSRAVEELRMLSNFQLGNHALLQSFLVGQPEFRQMMQSPQMLQLRQRVIAACHIGPLDIEETRAYIEHRLKHVGWVGNPRLQPAAYQAVYEATDGIPRRINSVCDRLLLSGFLSERRVFGREDVEVVAREIREETLAASAGAAPAGAALAPAEAGQNLADRSVAGAMPVQSAVPEASIATGPLSALDLETAGEVSRLIARMQSSHLEERLARLEQRVDATLTLLQQLLDAIRMRTAATGSEVPVPARDETE